jgi:IclR family pca regulon transcriptional regulator
MTAGAEDGGDFVQSLARGLAVIRAFDADHPSLRASEVAERAGVTRAAARRFLFTLIDLGYVRTDGRLYSLTPRVLELGGGYLATLGLDEIARPHLEALSREVGESVSAALLDGPDIVYVARVATRRIMSVNISLGTRFPAFATAMGRVLVASLDESAWDVHLALDDAPALTPRTLTDRTALHVELARVREQGWAEVDGELEEGLRAIAVPAALSDGTTLAVNVALGPVRTRPDVTTPQIVELLRTAADAIAADARAVATRS